MGYNEYKSRADLSTATSPQPLSTMPRRTKPRKRTKKVGAQVASKSSESKGDDRSEIPGEAAAAALLTRIASGTTQCESRQAEVAAGSLYHAMLGVGAAIKAKEITLRKRDFIRAVAAKKVAILAAGGDALGPDRG